MPNNNIVKIPPIQPTDSMAAQANIEEQKKHATFLIEKLLKNLPGRLEEIGKDLLSLLKNPDGNVSYERESHIKHIRYLLKDEQTKSIAKQVIENKLYEITKYHIENEINNLQASWSDIEKALNGLLLDVDATVRLYQSAIAPIQNALKDPIIGAVTREIIKNKINSRSNPPIENLPNDVKGLIMFGHLGPQSRSAMMRINKGWYLYAQNPHFNRLMLEEEFGLDPEETINLKSPYKVYMKLKNLKKRHCVYTRALRLMPISNLIYILDSITPAEKYEFFITLNIHHLMDIVNYAFTVNDSETLTPVKIKEYISKDKIPVYQLINIALLMGDMELSLYLIKLPDFKIGSNINLFHDRQLLISALLSGNLSVVKLILDHSQLVPNDECLSAAIDSGSLELVEYLFDNFNYKNNDMLNKFDKKIRAIRTGYILLAQYIFNKYHVFKGDILTRKDAQNIRREFRQNLTMMQSQPQVYDKILFLKAAMTSGNWKMMLFLKNYYGVHLELYPSDDADDFFVSAGKSDNDNMVNYLFEDFKNEYWPTIEDDEIYLLHVAARLGNLWIVKKLLNKGYRASLDLLNRAARSGELELVKYLITEHHIIPSQETLKHAAYNISHNNFVVMKYLLKNFPLKSEIDLNTDFTSREPSISFVLYLFNQVNYPSSLTPDDKKWLNIIFGDLLNNKCCCEIEGHYHKHEKIIGRKIVKILKMFAQKFKTTDGYNSFLCQRPPSNNSTDPMNLTRNFYF